MWKENIFLAQLIAYLKLIKKQQHFILNQLYLLSIRRWCTQQLPFSSQGAFWKTFTIRGTGMKNRKRKRWWLFNDVNSKFGSMFASVVYIRFKLVLLIHWSKKQMEPSNYVWWLVLFWQFAIPFDARLASFRPPNENSSLVCKFCRLRRSLKLNLKPLSQSQRPKPLQTNLRQWLKRRKKMLRSQAPKRMYEIVVL